MNKIGDTDLTPEQADKLYTEFMEKDKMSNIQDQPSPKQNESVPIWDLVIIDMQARDKTGRERYGTPLQANNGRDALIDAYQEALDLVVYLRQAIEERRIEQEKAEQ